VALQFTRLTAEHAPKALGLLSERWPGDWTDEFAGRFFAWRYLTRPAGETLLAQDGDRCVAILDSYLRPYVLSGTIATVRETCDWYCRPEYRPLGVGVRLMRQMMAKREPIIVVGGTEATHLLLPRLKWQLLPDVPIYVLPLSLKTAVAFGLRKFLPASDGLARFIPSSLGIFHPRRLAPPTTSAQVMISSTFEVPVTASSDEYALAPLLDSDRLNWLAQAPREVGDLLTLTFLIDGRLVAVSVTRLQRRPEGLTAKILHLQSEDRSPATIGWIVSQTALHLADKGVCLIICLASEPTVLDTLRRVGFLAAGRRGCFWWSTDGSTPSGRMNLTKMVGDDEVWAE
jgi:hypothetical protein